MAIVHGRAGEDHLMNFTVVEPRELEAGKERRKNAAASIRIVDGAVWCQEIRKASIPINLIFLRRDEECSVSPSLPPFVVSPYRSMGPLSLLHIVVHALLGPEKEDWGDAHFTRALTAKQAQLFPGSTSQSGSACAHSSKARRIVRTV